MKNSHATENNFVAPPAGQKILFNPAVLAKDSSFGSLRFLSPMSFAIEIEQLTCRYARLEAVRDLSLQVPEGSIYAFLGTNGAGKTTTIKTLLNLLAPARGVARVLGVPSTALGPAELARIGYLSADQRLPPALTVAHLIAYSRALYPTWDDAFCLRLVDLLALPLHRPIGQFSTGMKIKAALLIALAYRPRLLILDEPFSGLDPLIRDELVQGLLEVFGQEKWTLFISSHDIAEVEMLADWVGILDAGRLCLSEPLATVRARFRRLAVTGGGETSALAVLPPPLGALQYETAPGSARWIDPRFISEEASAAQVAGQFPPGAALAVTPLSLREIFVAVTRHLRTHPDATL